MTSPLSWFGSSSVIGLVPLGRIYCAKTLFPSSLLPLAPRGLLVPGPAYKAGVWEALTKLAFRSARSSGRIEGSSAKVM